MKLVLNFFLFESPINVDFVVKHVRCHGNINSVKEKWDLILSEEHTAIGLKSWEKKKRIVNNSNFCVKCLTVENVEP